MNTPCIQSVERIDGQRSKTARPCSALWRLRSGQQSLPIDPEIFGTKPPEHLGTANIQLFQIVPAALPFLSSPLGFLGTVLWLPHLPHADGAYSWVTASSHGRNTKACTPQKDLALARDTTL